MEELTKTRTRRSELDVLRILACFLVCYNHSYGFEMFFGPWEFYGLQYWVSGLMAAITAIDIPLYLMLSGALLLERSGPLLDKRILRFLVLLIVFSLGLYLKNLGAEPFSFQTFFYDLLAGNINLSYWYLYAYLGFLMMLPLLRSVVRGIGGREIAYLILLRFVFSTCIIGCNLLLRSQEARELTLYSNFVLPFSAIDILFYPLVGWYLGQKMSVEKIRGRHVMLCLGVCLGNSLLTVLMCWWERQFFPASQSYLGTFSYITAIAVFVSVRCLFSRITVSDTWARMLKTVSGLTMGIYLLEPYLHVLKELFFSRVDWDPVSITLASLVWVVLNMFFGGTITWVLKKLPVVGNFF